MNNKKHRIIALIMSIIIFVVVLGTSAFIAGNSHHDCIGDDCPICTAIVQCENIIRTISFVILGTGITLSVSFMMLQETTAKTKLLSHSNTLITLKVELLN